MGFILYLAASRPVVVGVLQGSDDGHGCGRPVLPANVDGGASAADRQARRRPPGRPA